MLSSGLTPARMYPYSLAETSTHMYMTMCTTCGCAPLNRLSVLSIPIISCIQYPGMYNGGWVGGGGGGVVTGDVESIANS